MGPNWFPMVPKDPPKGPKGPPWAQRVHLEAEGRLKGPLGPIGALAAIPIGGAIVAMTLGSCRMSIFVGAIEASSDFVLQQDDFQWILED